MNRRSLFVTLCVLLFPILGCERKAAPPAATVGPFEVNGDSGVANGEAFGIKFKVAGSTGAKTTSALSGSPESSSRAEILLGDHLRIELETVADTDQIVFRLNSRSYGKLQRGDEVEIGVDQDVMVNGEKRSDAGGQFSGGG
ncbi:hypothetical protein [Luteolibacter marinus]|uniref:hypothetical protein n=1 Tax=Luteolibacter marinus TaxID=2776705 RepID=UPI001D0147BD|nr:hypothetical protein [Luteolibacter marinus]